jgi:3-oxoacyl-[acyl-carrier protein] reductase
MTSPPFLIIGAGRGIGRGIAERLVALGHPVITFSRSSEGPSGVVEHIHADVVADGLPLDRIPDALSGVAYCPGSIDLKPFRSIRVEDLRAALEVNLVGAFRAAQATADRLKRVPGSSLLLFSTVAVGQGMPFHASVAAAKAGVEGLSRSLAAEWAPTVRVNCIAPSLTDTPLAERLMNNPEKVKAAGDRHPLKRTGTVDDIAAMAAFLMGPEAGWISGQVIGVDGGLSRLR